MFKINLTVKVCFSIGDWLLNNTAYCKKPGLRICNVLYSLTQQINMERELRGCVISFAL
jgi:hypothetical protein